MTKVATKNKDVPSKKLPTETKDSSLPAWKQQFDRVQGAIWKHDQDNGKVRYTVSISRSYKDEKGKWQSVHYFDRKDLLDVIAMATEAEDQILALEGMKITEPDED